MKFKLKHSVGVPAEVAGTELARINRRHGAVTPAHVVKAAEPEDAPLHPAFTWDDEKAAIAYRLQEARELIRAVIVVDDTGEDQGSAYVRVTVDDDSQYMPTADVVKNPDLLKSAVQSLVNNLEAAQRGLTDLEAQASKLGKPSKKRAIQKANRHVGEAREALGKVA